MRLQNLCILFLLILIISCEGNIQGNGKVISASNQLPIDSVKIKWLDKIVYSDKNGSFSFHEFVGCVPSCPDIELILTKQGYESKYINLTKENEEHNSVFKLSPTKKTINDLSHSNSKNLLFYLSFLTAIISLFTLIFLFTTEIKDKILWFIVIIFGTVTVHYNYLAKVTELKIFRPSLFLFVKYTFEPTWYQLNLPVGLFIFWTYYFYQLKNKQSYVKR